jgi:hypothetical protein
MKMLDRFTETFILLIRQDGWIERRVKLVAAKLRRNKA